MSKNRKNDAGLKDIKSLKKDEAAISDLGEISEVDNVKSLLASLSVIPTTAEIAAAEENSKKKEEERKERTEKVRAKLIEGAQIAPSLIEDMVRKIYERTALSDMDKEAILLAEKRDIDKEIAALEGAIAGLLASKSKTMARAAAGAVALSLIRNCPAQKHNVAEMVRRLVESGLVVKTSKDNPAPGSFDVGGACYLFADRIPVADRLTAYDEVLRKVQESKKEAKASYMEEARGLVSRGSASLVSLMTGEGLTLPATVAVTVPKAQATKDGKPILYANGGEKWYPGGVLLLEVIEEAEEGGKVVKIFPRDATEGIRRTSIKLDPNDPDSERISLFAKAPNATFITVEEARREVFSTNVKMTRWAFALCRILHGMLRRGYDAILEEEEKRQKHLAFQSEADAERVVFEKKATVTAEDFLLGGTSGVATIYLGRKPWVVKGTGDKKDQFFFEVFFSVRRSIDRKSKEKVLEIVDYPKRLEGLFEKKYACPRPEGEKFDGLGWPLRQMLQMAYAMAMQRKKENDARIARESDPDFKSAADSSTDDTVNTSVKK